MALSKMKSDIGLNRADFDEYFHFTALQVYHNELVYVDDMVNRERDVGAYRYEQFGYDGSFFRVDGLEYGCPSTLVYEITTHPHAHGSIPVTLPIQWNTGTLTAAKSPSYP
jgi:hypothetical protein